METGHATAKAVRPADISKPLTGFKVLSPRNLTRCAHLLPARPRALYTRYGARSAESSTLERPRMPCTSGSIATDLTSETRRRRNRQWLNTSIYVDTPWMTLRSWSLKRFQSVMFRLEEDVKNMNGNGLGHFVL